MWSEGYLDIRQPSLWPLFLWQLSCGWGFANTYLVFCLPFIWILVCVFHISFLTVEFHYFVWALLLAIVLYFHFFIVCFSISLPLFVSMSELSGWLFIIRAACLAKRKKNGAVQNFQVTAQRNRILCCV